MQETPEHTIIETFEAQKVYYASNQTKPIPFRIQQLRSWRSPSRTTRRKL